MAATLPAGLLEKMISLTESLLASLGDKNVPPVSTSAAALSYESNDGKNSIQFEDASGQSEVSAVSMVPTSLAPADISSNNTLKLGSSGVSDVPAATMVLTSQVPADVGSNRTRRLRRSSSEFCSADGAAQNKSHGGLGDVSFRKIKGPAKKSLIELDTISRHSLGQVM